MYQRVDFPTTGPTLRELTNAGVEIFNDWWDTYIPEHKKTLINKIIRRYYFDEIGTDTPDQFIWQINAHLERIMPYYNQLYASELIKINPLLNHSIEQSGRVIENLLTKANTSDDKFSKAIRDFAGVTDHSGQEASQAETAGKRKTDTTGKDNYSKNGTENITETVHIDDSENVKTHETKVTDGTVDKTEGEQTGISGSRKLDKTVTETPDETTVKKMDWGQTETGTENSSGNTTSDGTGSKNWTETRDDDATTHTKTDTTETGRSSAEKDYADTPQKELSVTTEDGTAVVRKDYLTNVTWDSGTSSNTVDTVQDVTYSDDETKDHKENTTDKTVTDTTGNTTTDKKKGGTDTETSTTTGSNVTVTDESESNTSDQNRNLTAGTVSKDTTNTDGTSDTTGETDTTRNIEKEWGEQGTADKAVSEVEDTSGNSSSSSTNSSSDQIKENTNMNTASTQTTEKTSEETTDRGKTELTSGFMNVSASALLEAFRKTFLNIDNMIIEELRDDFMLVY